jgi:type II secretory pathway pseudopilin PulG
MRRRAAGKRGYVLAEALVSAALASLAGVLAVTLLIWSARAIDRSQAAEGAIRVLDRLYQEARLASPDALRRPSSGWFGRYQWVRIPGRALGDEPGQEPDPKLADAPVPVRFVVQWRTGGKVDRRQLQAIVRPAIPEPAPPEAADPEAAP